MYQILHGKAEEILPQIKQEYIIITDPPYNQGYHYGLCKDNLEDKEYLKMLSIIKPPAVIIHYPEETINLFPQIFGEVSQVVSWVYNSNTAKQHRLISWWGCKPDFKKVLQPYKNLNDKRIKERIARGKIGAKLYDWWEIQQIKNVSKEKTGHPCQIPEKLIENIILTTTIKEDLVIDPFCGSGTTGVVCKKFNRHFIGIDIDINYCKIAEKRLK